MPNPVCWLTRPRLGAYLDGELGVVARAKTASHLTRCVGCAAELAALRRLHEAVGRVSAVPEPPAAVWEAFGAQVRARIAAAPPAERAADGGLAWPGFGIPRFALGSALAAAALALLVVLAPWREEPPGPPPAPSAPSAPSVALAPTPASVVVQSVETADPQSSVMVFSNAEADVTVVWVFGLEES